MDGIIGVGYAKPRVGSSSYNYFAIVGLCGESYNKLATCRAYGTRSVGCELYCCCSPSKQSFALHVTHTCNFFKERCQVRIRLTARLYKNCPERIEVLELLECKCEVTGSQFRCIIRSIVDNKMSVAEFLCGVFIVQTFCLSYGKQGKDLILCQSI